MTFEYRDLSRAVIDDATRAQTTIEYEHHKVHEGSAFTCHYSDECTNIGEMTVIAFNTPNTTKWVHLMANASVTAAAYIAIYETTSIDTGEGADLAIYNRNRNKSTTSTVSTIEATPEVNKATSFNESQAANANITTTTELGRTYMGAGTRNSLTGGETRGSAEFVLKQNTQYAIMVVSTTDDTNIHNLTLNWYENTNRYPA